MNIEIIEFYPMEYQEEKGLLTGTLRIKLPDIGINILGIFASKRKDYWFFSLPGRQCVHHETGKKSRYPFVVFEDENKQKELIAAIREQAPAFIEKRIVDTDKPLVWPQNEKKDARQLKPQKGRDNAMESEQMRKNVSGIVPSIANKVWHDPPPKKLYRKK